MTYSTAWWSHNFKKALKSFGNRIIGEGHLSHEFDRVQSCLVRLTPPVFVLIVRVERSHGDGLAVDSGSFEQGHVNPFRFLSGTFQTHGILAWLVLGQMSLRRSCLPLMIGIGPLCWRSTSKRRNTTAHGTEGGFSNHEVELAQTRLRR